MAALLTILDRALAGNDLSSREGLVLLSQTDAAAVADIRTAADQLRAESVGETVTYVVNRNLNFTNICEQHCNFCAFRRDGDQSGAYWLTTDQILAKTSDAVRQGATEICMQGGLHLGAKLNGRSLDYYLHLVRAIKTPFPELHLHAFSPQEVQFIAREDGLSYEQVLLQLRDAGVGSLPGTAAEVLHDGIRKILCPEKIDSATWLEIVGTAHRLGLPSTSTLLAGHIERPEHQIHHLQQLRELQQRSLSQGNTGITEFILLPYVGQNAPLALRKRVGRDQPVLAEALLLTAVARLYLGRWIANHQPSWVKLGLGGAIEALRWGCNDIGGTLMEEHITTMAGAQGGTCQSAEALQVAIRALGRPAAQRDTLYRRLPSAHSSLPDVTLSPVS